MSPSNATYEELLVKINPINLIKYINLISKLKRNNSARENVNLRELILLYYPYSQRLFTLIMFKSMFTFFNPKLRSS
jgi:hypothetical protein